jgi:hypothetical protein
MHMTGVFAITLRSAAGEERRTLAWFPTAAVREDYHSKAARRGLKIINETRIMDPTTIQIGKRYLYQMIGYRALVTVCEYNGDGWYKVLTGDEYRSVKKELLLPWCGEKYD